MDRLGFFKHGFSALMDAATSVVGMKKAVESMSEAVDEALSNIQTDMCLHLPSLDAKMYEDARNTLSELARMGYTTLEVGAYFGDTIHDQKVDKFKECGLTPEKSAVVSAPSIAEAPISIECRVTQVIPLGSHDMFIGEVVNVAVDEQYLDPETGKLDLAKAKLITYAHGAYYALGEQLGTFGWTVKGSKLRKEIKHGRQKK